MLERPARDQAMRAGRQPPARGWMDGERRLPPDQRSLSAWTKEDSPRPFAEGFV